MQGHRVPSRTQPLSLCKEGCKAAGLESRTGRKDPRPVLPRARAHFYLMFLTTAVLISLFKELPCFDLATGHFGVPSHSHFRKRSVISRLTWSHFTISPSPSFCFVVCCQNAICIAVCGLSESLHRTTSASSWRPVGYLPAKQHVLGDRKWLRTGSAVIKHSSAVKTSYRILAAAPGLLLLMTTPALPHRSKWVQKIRFKSKFLFCFVF